MNGPDETNINASRVIAAAKRLTTAGQALLRDWNRLTAQIEGLNASAPWGDDKAGERFNEHYLAGGNASIVRKVLGNPGQQWVPGSSGGTGNGGTELVQRVAALGPELRAAASETISTDEMIAEWFGKPA